jgi:hypothetical protein
MTRSRIKIREANLLGHLWMELAGQATCEAMCSDPN